MKVFALLAASLPLLLGGCTHDMSRLHRAAQDGDREFVRAWVSSGRDPDPLYDEPRRGLEGNYSRRLNITPLMLAAQAGNAEIVRLLVQGGAKVRAKSDTQYPGSPMLPFDFAATGNGAETAQFLWERTPREDVLPRVGEHLAGALKEGRLDMARFLVRVTPPEQLARGIGDGVCFAHDPEATVAFLEPLVPAFPPGTMDCTARYLRPDLRKSAAALDRMIAHGAPLDNGPRGVTPLMQAALGGNAVLAEHLLARGAKPDVRNDDGLDAAGFAANDQCFNPSPGLNEHTRRKVALIERLAALSPPAKGRMRVLEQCCSRPGQPPEQQAVCKVFGL